MYNFSAAFLKLPSFEIACKILNWSNVNGRSDIQNQEILEKFKKGDKVKVKILEINVDKERISLGIKQLESDPVQEYLQKHLSFLLWLTS